MKKALIAAVVLVAAVLVYWLTRPEPPLETARKAEAAGRMAEAVDGYAQALLQLSESRELPDKNRAKILQPEDWYREVEDYLRWVAADEPAGGEPAGWDEAMAGIRRCTTAVQRQILRTWDSTVVPSAQAYAASWHRAFFPANLTVEGNHAPLAEGAIDANVSILRIGSVRDFSYRFRLLDIAARRSTEFFLYPESEVSVLLRPGRHLLLGTSEVTFPNDQYWRSPMNVIAIEAPDTAALLSFVAKTRVHRGQ